MSLTGDVLGFSLPVSVRTCDGGLVGDMGLGARDLLGLSRGRGEPPVIKGRNKALGGNTSLEDEVVSLLGGGALGRLA